MFTPAATLLVLFSMLPALAHALVGSAAGLQPMPRGKKGSSKDSRKVHVIGFGGVQFPGSGNGGASEAIFDLVDGGSGEVNMAGKALTPYLHRNDLDPSGETYNFGPSGDKMPKLVEFEFAPTCHFNGKLTGDGDITFNFAPTTDFLYPCGDSHRGLEIVCSWNGKAADCLNKPFQ